MSSVPYPQDFSHHKTIFIFLEATDIVLAGFSNVRRLSRFLSSTPAIPVLKKECYQVLAAPSVVRKCSKKIVLMDITRCVYRRRNDADIAPPKFKNDFTLSHIVYNFRILEKFLIRFRKMFPNTTLVFLPVMLRYFWKYKYTYANYHPAKVIADMTEICLIEKKILAMISKFENMAQVNNIDLIGTDDPEIMVEYYKAVGFSDTIHYKTPFYMNLAKILKNRFNV